MMRFDDAVFHPGFSVVDTHCHFNLEPLWENWQSILLSARKEGVNFWWIPGTNIETSKRAITIASKEAACTAFVGIHPSEVAASDDDAEISVKRLERLKQEADSLGVQIGGVGEIGLDYFRLDRTTPQGQAEMQDQRLWLRPQLELAKRWDVPVILHVRDTELTEEPEADNAYWDTVKIVESVGAPKEFTLHCVSGPQAYVQRMLDLGAYCGFDGNLTYTNAHAIRALWRLVPAERRLLETDAPFLPPVPHRGQVCEPWMLRLTAEYAKSL